MKIQHIRHATMLIHIMGKKILVDPVFADKGTLEPVKCKENSMNNPLVSLPVKLEELLNVDSIMVTHTHSDHFDDRAKELLPRDIPIFCQPKDYKEMVKLNFQNILCVEESVLWEDIRISRIGGKHGRGLEAKMMGTVSGFVLSTEHEPTAYIAGDTVWCRDVENALDHFTPDLTICFAGAAQLLRGKPITMGYEDLMSIKKHAPYTKIIAVHMDAWNHCLLTRNKLVEQLKHDGIVECVAIPYDGELMGVDK